MSMAYLLSQYGGVDYLDVGFDVAMKSTVLFLVAALAAQVLRKASAAVRHRVWCLAFGGALILPVLSTVVPQWRIAILPASTQTGPTTVMPGDFASVGAGLDSESPSSRNRESHEAAVATSKPSDVTTPSAVWMWVAGLVVCLVPLFGGGLHSILLRHEAAHINEPAWTELWDDLKDKLHLRRNVRLLEIGRDVVPITWGIVRPIVLLPATCHQWNEPRRRFVLLHELAHIKRHDLPLQLIARVVCAIYWFHPLAWYALRRLHIEREQACDDCVVGTGEQASEYALELVEIAETHYTPSLVVGIGMARSSRLEDRLRVLFDQTRSHSPLSQPLSRALLLLACVLVLSVATIRPVGRTAQAQEGQPQEGGAPETFTSGDTENDDVDRISAAERSAEAALKEVGANIHRDDDGQVLVVFIPSARFGDEHVAHLRSLSWIETPTTGPPPWGDGTLNYPGLGVYGTQITDVGLAQISGLTQLVYLGITGNANITDRSLEHLKSLNKIERLALSGTSITDAGLASIVDKLADLDQLWIYDTKVTDAGLEHLKGLKKLKFLHLGGTQITDEGLVHLKGVTNLEAVQLRDTQISNEGLEHLQDLTNLRRLWLAGTKITDDGLVRLKELANLEWLILANTQVTDAGLVHLKGLNNLRTLSLSNTGITDTGLELLKGLNSLEWLSLSDTEFTDDGLLHVKGLNNLSTLDLSSTSITDAGLELLKGINGLEDVNLQGTEVSDEGISKLKEALPNCQIQFP